MKREIKFRAKKISDGDWVFGDLHLNCLKAHIHTNLIENSIVSFKCYIISDTIGQFTGMYDKHGNEIYEGDIIKWTNGLLYVVKFWEGMFYASIEECNDNILGGFPLHVLCDEDKHCEVVGNIYDNSELIKNEE